MTFKKEVDYAVAVQFDREDSNDYLSFCVRISDEGSSDSGHIHVFTAKKKHAQFFRALADKLEALP